MASVLLGGCSFEVIEGDWIYAAGGYHVPSEVLDLPEVPEECLSSYGEYVFIERDIEVSTDPIAPPGVSVEPIAPSGPA